MRSTPIARCWLREMLKPGLRHSSAELLPHGPAFVLLDALHDYGDEHASGHVDITPQSLFFEASRGVPCWVGVEYMAQAIGAYAGIVRRQSGQPIEIDRKSTRLNSSH